MGVYWSMISSRTCGSLSRYPIEGIIAKKSIKLMGKNPDPKLEHSWYWLSWVSRWQSLFWFTDWLSHYKSLELDPATTTVSAEAPNRVQNMAVGLCRSLIGTGWIGNYVAWAMESIEEILQSKEKSWNIYILFLALVESLLIYGLVIPSLLR